MKHFFQKQNGYTLAEAIVAIGILSSALLGTLVLAAQSINVTDIAQTKTQAEFLAEEGIELARAFREDSVPNFKIFDTTSGCTNTCPEARYSDIIAPLQDDGDSVQFNLDGKFRVCLNNINCYPLYINPTQDHQYVLRQGSNNPTRFKRIMTFTRRTDSSAHAFIEVTSQVDFTTRGTPQASTYKISTHFYDWL